MGRFHRIALIICAASLLGACASSETRSIVSGEDVVAGKYKRVAVFIENLENADRASVEQSIVSSLKEAGLFAASGADVLDRGGDLSEAEKANIIQKGFDAVLYFTVVEKGFADEPNSTGDKILYNTASLLNPINLFALTAAGELVVPEHSVTYVKMKADLEDTKSAKRIWASETIATGHAWYNNEGQLFEQAAKQIVQKIRTDHVI